MESLTFKVKQALSLQGETPADVTGHTFKSEDGSFPSNHRDEARVLPPNVTEAEFDKALEEFRKVVGRIHVEIVDMNTLMDGDYMHQPKTHDGFYVLDQKDLVASAVVRPGNTEDVQALVRIANKYKIPLWVTSIGRNLGYGGAARTYSNWPWLTIARVRGSVLLDMGARMNRILEVNEKYAYALVEPGVTFFDLYKYIQDHKLKLWVDVPDLGGGSILGNTVERGGKSPSGHAYNQSDILLTEIIS